MSGSTLGDVFTSTQEDLKELGITDDFFLDLLASRLVVERVGDKKNAMWWDSLVLSPTGRDRLEEVTPKTHVKARLDLAMKIGQKAESDRLPSDAVSLFSFGPRIETRLTAAIDDIAANEDITFEALENISDLSVESGWTEPLIEEIDHDPEAVLESGELPDPEPSGARLLGDDNFTESEIEAQRRTLLATFLRGYGDNTDSLSVPYYSLESDITAETA